MKPNVKILNENYSRNTPRPADSQQKNIKYYFVACYTHNIHEWSNFLYFVSCYYMDLDRDEKDN
jgi:hypothetical protein